MFNLFKKKSKMGTELQLKITDMHCTNCALTIDDELEETRGVFSARTNYAQAKTTVHYDPQQVEVSQLLSVIKRLGYTARIS